MYAFDVLATVGTLRFLECRQCKEIQSDLQKGYGVFIPERTIQKLIDRFVDTLRALHDDRVSVLREPLEAMGGYILHIDGTCEEGSQVHFAGLTGPEPMVLWSEKIDSENAIQIRGVLKKVEERFGRPKATVEDLSNSIHKAVLAQWPGLPVFYCHQHFLSDVGKDIHSQPYSKIRALLRRSKIRPKLRSFIKRINKDLGDQKNEAHLIFKHLGDACFLKEKGRSMKASAVAGGIAEWILSAPAEGKGRGFPFDLPHLSFYLRATRAMDVLDKDILPHLIGRTPRGEKNLFRLRGILHSFLMSRTLAQAARQIQDTDVIFTRLRDALRLAAEGSAHGINEGASDYKSPEEAQEAEQAVIRLREELSHEIECNPRPHVRDAINIVIRHLDKYWDGLFGHCLPVSDSDHRYLIVQRTNNMAERFFRGVKRFGRRISGKKKLNREVDALPGHALLVFNLKSPTYVKLVCGSLNRLPEAFADLAQKGKLPKSSDNRCKATFLDRKSRKTTDFPSRVATAFANG